MYQRICGLTHHTYFLAAILVAVTSAGGFADISLAQEKIVAGGAAQPASFWRIAPSQYGATMDRANMTFQSL